MLPSKSTATPHGALNLACAAGPSANPCSLPATVVVAPVGATLRILWFLVSAMYKLPSVSSAIPDGPSNLASEPDPSTYPGCGSPASVLTITSSWPKMVKSGMDGGPDGGVKAVGGTFGLDTNPF